MNEKFILDVFKFVAKNDLQYTIWWNEDLRLFVNVNDVFWWACSDVEEITEQNFDIFVESFHEIESISKPVSDYDVAILFASKIRKLRPQGAMYNYIEEKFWPLFDACGPVREITIGNPKKHPLEN